MCNKTAPQNMVEAAAANFKMQEHAAEVGPEREKLGVKVEDTENDLKYLKCQLRMEERRIDRLEKLVEICLEILLEDKTKPATEENRAVYTKRVDKVERQYKAMCAKQDAEEMQRRRRTRVPYSSDEEI